MSDTVWEGHMVLVLADPASASTPSSGTAVLVVGHSKGTGSLSVLLGTVETAVTKLKDSM